MQQSNSIVYIDINDILPNANQPRKNFNEETIDELAASIKEYGILNPILVRKKNDKYEIIAGERRYRASKKINLERIPVIIKELDDAKATEIALIENLQRENLTPIEEANTYQQILASSNITEEKLSQMIGKSQSAISNKIRLLNLTDEVKKALRERKISERHARSLLTIKDESRQIELLNEVISKRLSVKELDNIINKKEIEKESDNMNNGNFFPNYNNFEQNNNVSLNTMNMQTMGNVGMEQPIVQNTMETVAAPAGPMVYNEQPQPTPPVIDQQPVVAPLPQMPTYEEPANTQVVQEPILPQMPNTTQENVTSTNGFGDIPLFASQNNTPETPVEPMPNPTPSVQPVLEETQQPVVEPTPVIQDVPLFNTPTPETSVNQMETNFNIPVESTPLPTTAPVDNFTNVKNILDSNGIAYKAYSGDTGNCIIIEL